ncbi:hypothetical protein FDI24_gp054 [Acidovorax phage ACP17]|uniref:Uncharacterized protein n=1 Tax=Acidovorax phage ACP17 TaxID=2010329 RepID=A0A218M3F4_9CAUD|nr:hypothetical protein FDI24_gp054 [Acidovorax phage ACP17]ASD50583.1 hypothetical protein [Acidovorax phage ACP17]
MTKIIALRDDVLNVHDFLVEHASAIPRQRGFYIVHKPMVVYKGTRVGHGLTTSYDAITELEIPAGAEVFSSTSEMWCDGDEYLGSDARKMRASRAKVLRSWQERIDERGGSSGFCGEDVVLCMHRRSVREDVWWDKKIFQEGLRHAAIEVELTRSIHQPNFCYQVGQEVVPWEAFERSPGQCASGIHFFVNPTDAYYY